MATPEWVSSLEAPFVKFPENPRVVTVGGFKVLEYLSPAEITRYLDRLASFVRFKDFDEVLMNLNGGSFVFDYIGRVTCYNKPAIPIEYHKTDDEAGVEVVRPVPESLWGRRVLIVDDVHDTGRVLEKILEDTHSPTARAAVIVSKEGVEDKVPIGNIAVGVRIENRWVGGCGMDLGIEKKHDDCFRKYHGIVVKIPDEYPLSS